MVSAGGPRGSPGVKLARKRAGVRVVLARPGVAQDRRRQQADFGEQQDAEPLVVQVVGAEHQRRRRDQRAGREVAQREPRILGKRELEPAQLPAEHQVAERRTGGGVPEAGGVQARSAHAGRHEVAEHRAVDRHQHQRPRVVAVGRRDEGEEQEDHRERHRPAPLALGLEEVPRDPGAAQVRDDAGRGQRIDERPSAAEQVLEHAAHM